MAMYKQGGTPLGLAVRMFPTPYGLSANKGQGDGEFGKAIRNWATPTSHPRTHSPRKVDHGVQLANQVGGTLNPPWVEWLMGWPIGWTDLEPLEMDKFRLWLQQHGGY